MVASRMFAFKLPVPTCMFVAGQSVCLSSLVLYIKTMRWEPSLKGHQLVECHQQLRAQAQACASFLGTCTK